MAEKAVIELVVDPSGLKPGYDALKALGQLDIQQQEAFTKANAEFQASQQKTTVAVQNTAKAIQQIPKDIIGNTTKKAVDDVEKSMKQLGTETAAVAMKSLSLRQQLRQNTQALAELEVQGKRNTKEYQILLATTGELKDAMSDTQQAIARTGSDTRNIEGVIGVMQGATGVFAAASGAAALFGQDSAELQKQLLKVNAAMSLLQGVQSVQNLLQKESSSVLLFKNIQQKIQNYLLKENTTITAVNTVAEEANTVAEVENTVARTANTTAAANATIATRILNAVMSANPALAVAAAMLALAAAMQVVINWIEKTNVSFETQLEMQKLIIEAVKDYEKNIISTAKAANDAIQLTIEQRKKEGASLEEIQALENEQVQNRIKAANEVAYANSQQIKDLHLYRQILQDINKETQEYASKAKSATLDKKQVLELERLNMLQKLYQDRIEKTQGIIDEQRNAEIAGFQFEKQLIDKFYNDHIAKAQEVSIRAIKLSKQREQAEISAIQNTLKLELLNSGESEAQRKLGEAKAQEAIKQVRSKYAIDRLNDQRKAIDAELQLQTQGSQQQLALKLLDLSKAEQAELAVLHLTTNEKLDIEAKYQKQRIDLQAEYTMNVALRELAAQKVLINAKSAIEKEGNRQILSDSLALIDITQQEELAKARANYDELKISFEQYESELTRINADALNKRYDAEKEFKVKEIELRSTDINTTADHEKAVLELRKNGLTTGIFAKQKATQEEFDIEKRRLRAEKALTDQQLTAGAITVEQYAQKQRKIDDDLAANKQAKDKQSFEFAANLANQGFQQVAKFAQMAVQAWQEANDAYYQQRIATLEKAMNAELSLDNTSNVQKAAIRNKYLKEEREIKLKQWKIDQQAKEVQAGINIALGITSALATSGNIYAGIALAALVAATGAVELGIISSAKPPAFAEGVVNFQGKGTGNSDSNVALISHGESVITADATNKYAPYLEMMNAGMEIPQFSAPTVSSEVMNTFVNHMPEFDYNKFGEVVAEKLKQNPQFHLTLDQHGYNVHVQKGIHRTQELNNRISTK